MTNQLLTPTQAAETLAMTKGALAQLRYLDTGPRYVKVSGRSVRYREQDLDAWIRANIHGSNEPHDAEDATPDSRTRKATMADDALINSGPPAPATGNPREPARPTRA